MTFQRGEKSTAWSPQTLQKTSSFAPRPFAIQAQQADGMPATQEQSENEAFEQEKFEAMRLQMKQGSGAIAPEEQERLGVLQAKISDFSTQRREMISGAGFNFGNISVERPDKPASLPIQTKLAIGEPGDKYEQEADRMAAHVVQRLHAPPVHGMDMSKPPSELAQRMRTNIAQRSGSIQRLEIAADEDELMKKPEEETLQREEMPEKEEELQMKPMIQCKSAEGGMNATPDLEASIQQARGGGQPLPDSIREPMAREFGADFSGVKVHTDATSDELNQSIQAKAFTTGQDIFFRQGAYEPSSRGGQELIAHELTHVVQQNGGAVQRTLMNQNKTDGAAVAVQERIVSGRVQRKELSPKDILNALSSISFVKKNLKQTQHLRRDDKRDKDPTLETMRQHVENVLAEYDTYLRRSNDKTAAQAISVAVVLEAVARVIAVNQLNDPGLTPELTTKLMELYRKEIEAKLKKMDDRKEVLELAKVLTADDPVSLYMHNELRLEDAALRVQMMARHVNKTPVEFFGLLRQRFEIEMATYNKKDVKKREDTGNTSGGFNVKEATGEMSVAYLERLFPGDIAQWKHPSGSANNELDFTPESANKLQQLELAVNNARLPNPNNIPTRNWQRRGEANPRELTKKQSAHLAETEQQDASLDLASLDDRVNAKLQSMFNLNYDSAAELIERIKGEGGLATLPITLTVKGASWFSTGQPSSTIYKPGSSRKKKEDYYKLLGKGKKKPSNPSPLDSISYLGDFDDTTGQERGKNYGRFRNWKDQTMTGNRGFSDAELPSFAAVNINWPAHSSHMPTKFDPDNKEYGKNSYGDCHFILKKANITGRLVYTATDHGKPRRDIYLAFCDLLLGDNPAQSQTGLKKTENPSAARHVVNSLITGKLVKAGVQCFEVQIFGELDISKDVEKISVAPSVADDVKQNISNFCINNNIIFEPIAKPTEAVEHETWFKPNPGQGTGLNDQLSNALMASTLPQGF